MPIVVPDYTHPVRRVSETWPQPAFTAGVVQDGWAPTAVTRAVWGTVRVIIDGTDVTDLRGGLVTVTSWEYSEPFGEGPAQLQLDPVLPHDVPGSGDLAWLRLGSAVDLLRVKPDTTTVLLWAGEVVDFHPSTQDQGWSWTVDCHGVLSGTAALQRWQPPTWMDPLDIGTAVPLALNRVVSRRYNKIPYVVTGIATSQRGSSDQSCLDRATELLSTATTDDGSGQWTVGRTSTPRTYTMRLKDRTTQDWTVRVGQPGVLVDLTKDATQAPNVIYGRGVSTNGLAWAGWVYPYNRPDAAPGYPFNDPDDVIDVGTTDGDTDSGSGVSAWQERVNDLNVTGDVRVDGMFNSNDAAACRIIQEHYGIQVDGVVGPQTWAATFAVGSNGADLHGAYRLPLAIHRTVNPRNVYADGADAGANPQYDPSVLRVEADIDFGAGISKSQARRSANAQINRDYPAGWTGSVTLAMDPQEGSRFDVQAGQNIRVAGWGGSSGVLLHIAQVSVSLPDSSVSLQVDQKARDALTLAAIIDRKADNASNPTRLPPRGHRRSAQVSDTVVEFDGESPGGVIPDFALYAGLWSVIHIPVAGGGRVASVNITSHGPASRFSVAFFGDAVTAEWLIDHVGNPLEPHGHYGPYDWDADALAEKGFVQAMGAPGQAAGYGHGYETSPYTQGSTGVTGVLTSTASWEYRSAKPPWLWIAFYSPVSTRVKGRILPAPVGQ